MGNEYFKLVLLKDASDFVDKIPPQAADKLLNYIYRIKGGERNSEIFKKLENSNIWEFRAQHNNLAYRLFAFWDKDADTLVVATHGLIKKTQKTPSKEIAKAERLRKEYFDYKRR